MKNLRNYVKKNKGITLVSLVVTIIVLIILAGVSINLTLGENGIITVAKKAKENIELAKVEEETRLNELYTQIEAEGGATGEVSYDAIAKLSEFKKSIADYIEEAGGVKPEYTASSTTFGDSIKGIVTEVTKNATATADNITEGKTAWVNGKLITGNGADYKTFLDSGYKIKTGKVDVSYGRSWTYKYFDIDYSDMGFKSVPYFGGYCNAISIGVSSIESINESTCRFWVVQYGDGTGEGCYVTWVVCGK